MLVGLACKNAILIVEFARDRRLEGASAFAAALEAARERLRPIVMTTLCFVHMLPPYFAAGAGAEMRRSVGTAMLWGAFGVTLFGLFLTPVFYSVMRRLTEWKAVKPVLAHGLDTVPARATEDRDSVMALASSPVMTGQLLLPGLPLVVSSMIA